MIDPLQIWKGFHWSFFINIQGLIICLRRFEIYINLNNLTQAQIELATATEMMLASSATMELAGSFSKQEYQNQVRNTMIPPNVQATNFSGLMSWEHAALIQIWKRLRPIFQDLPSDLQVQHQEFIYAYFELVKAHRSVCEKFGGTVGGSLRFEKTKAVDSIDKFARSRWQLIDPKHEAISSCPFSQDQS
ncbi:hypothetical protein [Gloeocapsa sp. PCC 73106]|uniref:hypothetical protein n=1 Tax=Gloeocapsa sp. PCC 73106 TaxID=102232 RepID=UPI0002ACB718|nr:hypothetical protein [Gloeocapsa sp. PCC 73106]ELR97042.1 hypothetical protein GLO73106DRAFT_00008450 [Gloeocapsa sp. PCC 73106]